MFLLIVLFLVSINFYDVSTEHNKFKQNNSDTLKLLKVKVPENFIYKEKAILKVVFEVVENGSLKKIEDTLHHRDRKMELNHLKIVEIQPGAFKTLNKFETLNLADNKIKIVGSGIFNNLKDIKYLDLSNNEISIIEDDAFNDMPDVVGVYLTKNKITTLNENWFKNSPKLVDLMLNHNKIEKISENNFENFAGPPKVIGGFGYSLDFSFNKINEIHPHAFRGILSIRYLNISRNMLTELPKNLFKNIFLVAIFDISHNNISCTQGFYGAELMFILDPPICS